MLHEIFLSHAWNYENSRDGFAQMLEGHPGFEHKFHSVPNSSPVHKRGIIRELNLAIAHEMRHVGVVVQLSGMYDEYKMWIDEEIATARDMNKRILLVEPWGEEYTVPAMRKAADGCVGWDSDKIVRAIRRLSRPANPGERLNKK